MPEQFVAATAPDGVGLGRIGRTPHGGIQFADLSAPVGELERDEAERRARCSGCRFRHGHAYPTVTP
jgi:hypothetical protein